MPLVVVSSLDAAARAFAQYAPLEEVEPDEELDEENVLEDELSALEGGLTRWIEAAADDGRLETADPGFAAEQFAALLKAFSFWPQVAAGQAAPDAAGRRRVIDESVAMFLARYSVR